MYELKRILSNRKLCIVLILVLLINGILFAREQVNRNYGMDCSLPQMGTTIIWGESNYETATEKADARKSYEKYLQWLDNMKELPLSQAVVKLEEEKDNLYDILAIANLFQNGSGLFSEEQLNNYRENKPNLVSQVENGEINIEDTKISYVAINNLLEQTKYLSEYGDWLDTIQKNKENMLLFPIFNDMESFSGRNIIKTAEEFEKLKDVPLSLGANGAIESLLSFSLTDYLLIAILLLFGVLFLEERQKGLWNVVHATPNGRLRLALNRIAILFCISICSVLLLYGTNLIIGFSTYGGIEGLGRAVQSVEMLGNLPMLYSVGGFLAVYFVLRIFTAFFIGLLLWLLLSASKNQKIMLIVLAVLLVIEYGLYAFLPIQSSLNAFKYFNLFTYISMSDLFVQYLNIDLFGYPFGIRNISEIALAPLILAVLAACTLIHCLKKPTMGGT